MQNSESKIRSSPAGTAVFGLTHRPDPRVDFLIREETALINELNATTKIPLRARLFKRNSIAIVVIMFQLKTSAPRLFETFWDYYMDGGYGKKNFELISNQEDIAFHLYGDSGIIEKSILMNNVFKGFFKAAEKKILDIPEWGAEQFEKELNELRLIYPTKEALWEAIK